MGTALHWAARNGHAAVCEIFLGLEDLHAVNEQNLFGWTVLHYAATAGMLRVCERLLAHAAFRAPVEVTNNGETALHWAAMNGHYDVCKLLLSTGGVDPGVQDVEGLLAEDGARRHGHEAICQLLTQHHRPVQSQPPRQVAAEEPQKCSEPSPVELEGTPPVTPVDESPA